MPSDRTTRTVLCAFLLALTTLTVLACLLTWRAMRIVSQVEKTVAAIGKDVQSLSGSVAEMGQTLEEMVDRMARIERQAERASGLDDAERALQSLGDLREEKHANPQKLSPTAEAEIEFLLECIRTSETEFIEGDDRRSATYFALHLWAKYRYFRKALGSAEDFIEKVATRTLSGYPYRVQRKDGSTTELAAWLKLRLLERRSKSTPNGATNIREETADAPGN